MLVEGYALWEFIEEVNGETVSEPNEIEWYYMNFSYVSEYAPGTWDLYFSSYGEFHSRLSFIYQKNTEFVTNLSFFLLDIPQTADEVFISVWFIRIHEAENEIVLEIDVDASWIEDGEQFDVDEWMQFICENLTDLATNLSIFLQEWQHITEYMVANSDLLHEDSFVDGFEHWLIIDDDLYEWLTNIEWWDQLWFILKTYAATDDEEAKSQIVFNIADNEVRRTYIEWHIKAWHIQKLKNILVGQEYNPFTVKLSSEQYWEFWTSLWYPCDFEDKRFIEIIWFLWKNIDWFPFNVVDMYHAGFSTATFFHITWSMDDNGIITLDLQFIDNSLESAMHQVNFSIDQLYTLLCGLNNQGIMLQEYIHWE